MEKQQILTRTLAVIVVIASVIPLTSGGDQSVSSCCRTVSRNIVNDSIISYRLQNQNLPCIKAVIFKTERGIFCLDWKAQWVREKLRQFRAQNKLASTHVVTSTPTSSSISNFTRVGGSTQTNDKDEQQGNSQKLSDCCTNVSRNIVNDSIIGYRLQNQSLPCIKAVILKTEVKTHCVFLREKWAWKKICNFETNGGSDCVKPRSWAKKTFPKFFDKKN
ncbi:uncharacterized protein LOC130546938 isoform X1 [Triplophysa rosa]|uniref:uncharacterized protein LOC130546938 isoform X1 n=1 Tax=Triplophysa rosa TaxID=992332 RepID=UPI002546101E|nr:uncharacterized protein LOC130546938 isoform X1 [Triplophysa rosa]